MPARTGLLRIRRPDHRAPERLRSLGGGLRSWLPPPGAPPPPRPAPPRAATAPPLLPLSALHERRTSPKNRDVPKNSSSPAEGVATAAPLQRRRDRLRGLGGGSVRGSPCGGPARLRLTSLRPPPSACSAHGAPRCEGAGNRRTRGVAGGSARRPVERGGDCVERNRQRG